ncbi:MAG: DUF3857 domain-containing protein [Caulobacter sp.]
MYGEGDGAGVVGFAPAADWADLPAFAPGRPAPPDGIDGGRRFWLSDSQVDIRGGRIDWLSRVISEVVSADGLQATGQISIDLDPTYQRLDIHFVRVLRGGETREVDLPQVLSVFRRERDLERAMYDGRLTAHLVVPDVRVGDVVDFAYTLGGAHPALKGWFAAGATMQWNCWVEATRLRLLADADRPIASHVWGGAPAARTTPFGVNGVERVWTQLNDPGQRDEPEVPAWVTTHAGVRVADVMTWAQVADVFSAGYASPDALPADLERLAAEIEAAEAAPAGRAARALSQVQRDLRYHSVSLGEGGFTPRPVERIWAARAGDCKDASRLLTVLMRRLGLDACPALVNTFTGHALADRAPDVHAFNHCIVRLRIDGKTYWLDPTNYPQGGRLEAMTQARCGWALPLVEGAVLEAMGESAPERLFEVREVYDLEPAAKGGGVLNVDAIYRGWRADAMRRRLSSEGAGRTLEDYRQFYERTYGEAQAQGELEIEDDLEANTLRIRERHYLPKAWKPLEDGRREFTTVDELFSPQFTLRRVGQRRHPIELGLPREMVCETIIRVQDDINLTEWDDHFVMDGVEAHSSLGSLGKREFVLKRRAQVSRRWLRADEAARFFDLREGALRSAGVTLWVRPEPAGGKGKGDGNRLSTFAVIWLVIVAALFLFKVMLGLS